MGENKGDIKTHSGRLLCELIFRGGRNIAFYLFLIPWGESFGNSCTLEVANTSTPMQPVNGRKIKSGLSCCEDTEFGMVAKGAGIGMEGL